MDLPRPFTIREASHRVHNALTSEKLATLGRNAEPGQRGRGQGDQAGNGAVAVRPAAWARTGPAAAPARVAAASPVRKTAPIRPRTALVAAAGRADAGRRASREWIAG